MFLTTHIRPATGQDADILYQFLCDLEEMALNRNHFNATLERNLADPLIHYLIAECDGQVVGFVSCHIQYLLHHAGKVGEIQELYVLPPYRNQQIGQKLIQALEELARQQQLINLEVTANQKRTETHRFYQRWAFQPTHFKFVRSFQ